MSSKSESYERRINIYINGKEVPNTIASIKNEMLKLTNEQARLTRGSEEYNRKAAEIVRLKNILREHQMDISATRTSWDRLKEGVMGVVVKFGAFTAGALAAWKSVKSVLESTEGTKDKLEEITAGLKGMFWQLQNSIATLDFSNFFSNIRKAYEDGKQLEEQMDALRDSKAYDDYLIKQMSRESRELQATVKNKKLDLDVRKKAASDRLNIEQQIYDRSVKIANDTFAVDKKAWEIKNKMTVEEAKKVYETIDSLTTEQKDKLNSIFEDTLAGTMGNVKDAVGIITNGLSYYHKEELKAFSPEILASYGKFFTLLKNGEADVLPKLFDALAKYESAVDDAQQRLNTVIKESSNMAVKGEDSDLENDTDTNTGNNNSAIPPDYSSLDITGINKQIDAKKLLNVRMKQLDSELAAQQNESLRQSVSNSAAADNTKLTNTQYYYDRLKQLREDDQKNDAETIKDRISQYQMLGEELGNALGNALKGGNDAFKQAAKEIILLMIDLLRDQVRIWEASLTAKNIAQNGIIRGLLKSAPEIVLVEAIFAAAKAAVNNWWEGGFTGTGDKYEPAGIVHKGEWVANHELVASPVTGPIIAALENFRTGKNGSYADGGFVGSPFIQGISPEFKALMNRVTSVNEKLAVLYERNNALYDYLSKNGVNANLQFGYREARGVRKSIDDLNALEDGVSL